MLMWGALATVAAPAIYVVARFMKPPKGMPSKAVVGRESELGPDAEKVVRVGTTDAIVMRDQGGKLYALDLRCTHAGCNVAPAYTDPTTHRSNGFYCACHGGAFDREGNVKQGPPKLPLVRLEVRVEKGEVVVSDTPA
jgi:Rieske Fe-S protein